MKTNKLVLDVMTSSLISLDVKKHTVYDAMKIFQNVGLRNIPVRNGDQICGIISKNVIKSLSPSLSDMEQDSHLNKTLRLDQVMSSHEFVVSSDTPLVDVANLFISQDFNSIPVVDNDKLVGIITTTDLIKFLLDELSVQRITTFQTTDRCEAPMKLKSSVA
jgi:acetoin utilization protein AcuB